MQNLDLADLATGDVPFEVLGTLSFVMERDGIFAGCAVSDALRSALLGVVEDALDVLIANSAVPPTTEELIDLHRRQPGRLHQRCGQPDRLRCSRVWATPTT